MSIGMKTALASAAASPFLPPLPLNKRRIIKKPRNSGLFDWHDLPVYFMWAEASFVISNMVTSSLPPKTSLSLSSARIFLLLEGF